MKRSVVLVMLLSACGSTGQEAVSFPVHGAGTGEDTFDTGEWTVTLERADVGFGPVYFCATSFGDMDVCPKAEAEWLGTATIDGLSATPEMLGEVVGVTATVRSAMFDYGRSWLLTATRPRANEGAPDGHSAVFVVRASDGEGTLEVRASVDIDPANAGQSAIIGARVGTEALEGDEALVVRIDPLAWWRRVNFDALRALDEDEDGVVELRRGDDAYESLVVAMTAGTLPRFEWMQP